MLCQPGDCKKVTLVKIGGNRVIRGGNGIADGPVDDAKFKEVMEAVKSRGFGNKEEENARCITFYPDTLFYFFPVNISFV